MLRENYGVNVVGMWERGHFELPNPSTMLNNHTVLLLAGTKVTLPVTTRIMGIIIQIMLLLL